MILQISIIKIISHLIIYRINCNIELHNEFLDSGEITCPFCNQNLDKKQKHIVKYDLCCDCQNIINDKGKLVCQSCGVVQGYEYVKEYVDFHQNMHKMKRKSIYHRKYHIINKLLDIKQKYNIQLTYQQQNNIEKIFSEIDKVTNQINNNRKRLISINYILIQILKKMNLPFEKIPISKSKKTLTLYQKYWKSITELVDINNIIQ